MTPVITVVTITYNDLSGFNRTASSVIPQLSPCVEWIIKDGGSRPDILQCLSGAISGTDCLLLSSRDDGVYHAMNLAMSYATGDWLIFMNGGDVFDSDDTISRIIDFIEANEFSPEHDLILGGGTNLVLKSGKTIYKPARVLSECLGINSYRMAAFHQSQIISRAIYCRQRFQDNLSVSSDHAFFWEAIVNGASFVKIDMPISAFYLGGLSSQKRFRSCLEVGYSIFAIQGQSNLFGFFAFIKRLLVSYIPRSFSF